MWTVFLLSLAVFTSGTLCMELPKIKLFEYQNGNLAAIEAPPNTDVVLMESDNSTERYILLQCKAPYPVQWIYSGDGIPEFVTNTSVQWDTDPTEFTASAGIFRLSEHHTGTYTCRSTQSPKTAMFYYLFITGDSLLTSSGGDTIMFKPADPTVRIPCSVSHPKVRVTLQKLVDGYINCPVNDSISFSMKTGFTLTISDAYQPEGDYVCIASYKGKFTVVEYRVENAANVKIPEPEDYPLGTHSRPGNGFGGGSGSHGGSGGGGFGGGSYNPGPSYPSSQSKLKCSSFPCGRNAICRLNEEGEPICKCQRHFHGDPYVKCHPECVQDTDCPSNRVCSENACFDPCPAVCGVSLTMLQTCQVLNHTAVCDYNNCNPSPCGPFSKCEDFQTRAICTCLPGYYGSPPRCSEYPQNTKLPQSSVEAPIPSPSKDPAGPSSPLQPAHDEYPHQVDFTDVCRSNRECPPSLQCVNQRCIDPCTPNPCGRSTVCHVHKHEPVCSCAPGFIKVNQYCLPTNCRSQRDCPDNKACVRNKCINPCAGYCGKNSECRVQLHLPRCFCAPGFTGNPFKATGCSRITILTGTSAGGAAMQKPITAAGGVPAAVVSGAPSTSTADSACGPTRAKCGKNAKCIRNSTCECEDGYSGDPHRFCYLIISIPDSALTDKDIETESGFDPEIPLSIQSPNRNQENNFPSSNSISGSIPSSFYKESTPPPMIITKDSCTKNEHCASDKICHSGTCLNPCIFFSVCGENQECLTINHKAVCQCKIGYPIKIYNNCYARENHTTLSRCEPSPCGPNSECSVSEHGVQCKCKPNTLGSPPECRTKCSESFECPELLACAQGVCQDPCENACGKLARCRVYHQTAKCFCPRGFNGNPRVACSPPKFNSRLAGENQASLIEIFDKSDPGSSHHMYVSPNDEDPSNDSGGAGSTESIAGFDYVFDADSNDTASDLEKQYDEYVLKISNSKFTLETTKKQESPRVVKEGAICIGESCQEEVGEDTTLPVQEVPPSTTSSPVVIFTTVAPSPVFPAATFRPKEKMPDGRAKFDLPHYDDYADDSREFTVWKG